MEQLKAILDEKLAPLKLNVCDLQKKLGEAMKFLDLAIARSTSDPTSMFDKFYPEISETVDRHIPIKQLSRKELQFRSKAWITPALKVSIHIKNKIYEKFLKTNSLYYHSKFRYYRNRINHLLKVSKSQYFKGLFINYGQGGGGWCSK